MAHGKCLWMRCRAAGAMILAALLLLVGPVTAVATEDAGLFLFRYTITEEGVTIEEYCGTNLSTVTVPETIDGRNVVRIGAYAFADEQTDEESGYTYIVPRGDIATIDLPNGLIEIERGAFQGLQTLRRADVPDSVTKLGFDAFRDCTELSEVRLSENLAEIPANAFQSCGLSSLTIPEGVTRIGDSAFAENRQLTAVELPESLTEIGDGAFGSCTSLTQIDIPDGVSRMGVGCLGGTALRECTIPAGITEISAGLFSWCDSLETVRFRAVPEKIVQNAFLDCTQLQTVEVDATSEEWQTVAFDGTGNASLLEARTLCLRDDDPQSSSAQLTSSAPASFLDSVMLQGDSALRLETDSGQWQLRGPVAGSADNATKRSELLGGLILPDGIRATVESIRETDDIVATGDRIQFTRGGEILSEVIIIVDGDVLGSGVMSLSQLVRMTSALSGDAVLAGPFLKAGDFTHSGSIDLSDIVRESAMLKAARS